LFKDRLDKVVLITDIVSLSYLVLVPLAGSPIEGPSSSDQPVIGSANFLHGSLIIRSMAEDNIDIVIFKVFKGSSHTFNDVLSGESPSVGNIGGCTPEYFCGEDEVVPGDVEGLEGLSDLSFCLSIS